MKTLPFVLKTHRCVRHGVCLEEAHCPYINITTNTQLYDMWYILLVAFGVVLHPPPHLLCITGSDDPFRKVDSRESEKGSLSICSTLCWQDSRLPTCSSPCGKPPVSGWIVDSESWWYNVHHSPLWPSRGSVLGLLTSVQSHCVLFTLLDLPTTRSVILYVKLSFVLSGMAYFSLTRPGCIHHRNELGILIEEISKKRQIRKFFAVKLTMN